MSFTTLRCSVPDNVKKTRSNFTELQDELFARLIAREKIKNGRMPDFSWEFWRDFHNRRQFWSLIRRRPASTFQTHWQRFEAKLKPLVESFVAGAIDGVLITKQERRSGVTAESYVFASSAQASRTQIPRPSLLLRRWQLRTCQMPGTILTRSPQTRRSTQSSGIGKF